MPVSDSRTDPIEIIARVGGSTPDVGGSERAFQVWAHMARKVGWETSQEEHYGLGGTGTACGSLVIEGLRYVVHYGLRVRRTLADDSTGELRYRASLGYAAWVEPDLERYELA